MHTKFTSALRINSANVEDLEKILTVTKRHLMRFSFFRSLHIL